MKFNEAVKKYVKICEGKFTIKDFIEDWGEEFDIQELIDILETLDHNGLQSEDGYISRDELIKIFSDDQLVDDIISIFLEESEEDEEMYSFDRDSYKDLNKLEKYLKKKR